MLDVITTRSFRPWRDELLNERLFRSLCAVYNNETAPFAARLDEFSPLRRDPILQRQCVAVREYSSRRAIPSECCLELKCRDDLLSLAFGEGLRP